MPAKLELEYFGQLHGPTADKAPSIGPMVQAVKRVIERWDPDMFPGNLGSLDDVYNLRTVHGVKIMQRRWGLHPSGKWTKATHLRSLRAIRGGGTDRPEKPTELAWDALAIKLYKKGKPRVPPARCYIYPEGVVVRHGGGVRDHNARPLGNWQSDNAIDEHAAAGVIVVSPKPGYVSKGGGFDPHGGPVGTIFGEHTTIECDDGTAVFVTHLDRIVSVGERVLAGEIIGRVGDWPRSSAMDHAHVGARGFNPEDMRNWPRVRSRSATDMAAERVEVYRAKDGYRWRRVAVNEEQVSESGEGYVRKIDAVRMAKRMNTGVPIVDIEVRDSRPE